jgi:hypothetical protein
LNWRSVGAVFAGLLLTVVLSTVADAIFHGTGIFPPIGQPMSDALFAFALTYRIVFAIAGNYTAARLAPKRPMAHSIALGIIGTVLATAGAIATWNAGPAFGPHWYPLALIATALPCAYLAGKFREPQLH